MCHYLSSVSVAFMCHYLSSVFFLVVAELPWPVLVMLVLAPWSGPHLGREGDTCRDLRSAWMWMQEHMYKEQRCPWGDSEARGDSA